MRDDEKKERDKRKSKIPLYKIMDKINLAEILEEWVLEDKEEREPIFWSIYDFVQKKFRDSDFAELLKSIK